MIRKAIIVMLTLAAVGAAVLLVVSFKGRSENFGWAPPAGLLGRERGWGKMIKGPADEPWIVVDASKGQLSIAHFTKVDPSIVVSEETFGLPGLFVRKATVLPPRAVALTEEQFLMHRFSVPLWLLLPLFAVYPTIAFIRGPLRRRRRRRKGLCLKCGYNLTGNESGVCPECGRELVKP